MNNRFIVAYTPDGALMSEQKPFFSKGLAFALAKKKVSVAATVAVIKQVSIDGEWRPVDIWTFHQDGRFDHTRV